MEFHLQLLHIVTNIVVKIKDQELYDSIKVAIL